ncbi:MAG TPA: GtrA family protein [Lacunisphaera sp.]
MIARFQRWSIWLLAHPVVRWLLAGLAFMGLTSLFLYVFVDQLGTSVMVGTLLSLEASTLLRFYVNEKWVFASHNLSWRRLGQYHVANAGASAVWWVAANLLNHFGVHHLLAAVLAVGLSTGVSMASNFLWVWRAKHPPTGP